MTKPNLLPAELNGVTFKGLFAFGILFKVVIAWGLWHSGTGWSASLPTGGSLACRARLMGGGQEHRVGEKTIRFKMDGTDHEEMHFRLSRNAKNPYADRVDVGVSRWYGVTYTYYDEHNHRTSTHSPIVFSKKGESTAGYRFSTEIANRRLGRNAESVSLDCTIKAD